MFDTSASHTVGCLNVTTPTITKQHQIMSLIIVEMLHHLHVQHVGGMQINVHTGELRAQIKKSKYYKHLPHTYEHRNDGMYALD